MKFCVETEDGQVLTVTTLFNIKGDETKDVHEAVSCVIEFPKGGWAAYPLDDRAIQVIQ